MKAGEKKKNLADVIMNPVRQRIAQYLLIHETGTTAAIGQELSDIPPASLYRHMKVLLEAGCIEIESEKKVRGVTEKTYRLVQNPMGDVNNQDVAMLIQTSLLSIVSNFQRYFAKEMADPQKDLLSVSTSTLMLSDEEFMQVLQKIGSAIHEVINNKPEEGRKPRSITFISAPVGEEVHK